MSLVPRFKGILFDLDETLIQREDAFWCWMTRENAGVELDEVERAAIAELDGKGRKPKGPLLEHLAQRFAWQEEGLEERLERFRRGLTEALRVDYALTAMLERLKGAYRLGIVSNGTSQTQRAKIERLGFERWFDPILISEEVGCRKPESAIFEKALSAWGLLPEEVLFVGDDWEKDVLGPRAAGMKALWVGAPEAELGSVLELEAWFIERG